MEQKRSTKLPRWIYLCILPALLLVLWKMPLQYIPPTNLEELEVHIISGTDPRYITNDTAWKRSFLSLLSRLSFRRSLGSPFPPSYDPQVEEAVVVMIIDPGEGADSFRVGAYRGEIYAIVWEEGTGRRAGHSDELFSQLYQMLWGQTPST